MTWSFRFRGVIVDSTRSLWRPLEMAERNQVSSQVSSNERAAVSNRARLDVSGETQAELGHQRIEVAARGR